MAESKVTLLIDAKLGPQLANIDKLGAKIRKALSISSVIDQYTELEGKLDSIAKKIGAIQGVPGGGTNQITAAHGGGRSVGDAVRATSGAGTATIFGPRGEVLSTVNMRGGGSGGGRITSALGAKELSSAVRYQAKEQVRQERREHRAQFSQLTGAVGAQARANIRGDVREDAWGAARAVDIDLRSRPSLGRGFGEVDIPIGADGLPRTRPQTRPAYGRDPRHDIAAVGHTVGFYDRAKTRMALGGDSITRLHDTIRLNRKMGAPYAPASINAAFRSDPASISGTHADLARAWMIRKANRAAIAGTMGMGANAFLQLGVGTPSAIMSGAGGMGQLGQLMGSAAGTTVGIGLGGAVGMGLGVGLGAGGAIGGAIGGAALGGLASGVFGIGGQVAQFGRSKGVPALQALTSFAAATGNVINPSDFRWALGVGGDIDHRSVLTPEDKAMRKFVRGAGSDMGYDAMQALAFTAQTAATARVGVGGWGGMADMGPTTSAIQRVYSPFGVTTGDTGRLLYGAMRGGGARKIDPDFRGNPRVSYKTTTPGGLLRDRVKRHRGFATKLGLTEGEAADLFRQEAMLSSAGFVATGMDGGAVMENLVSGGAAFGGGFRGMQIATGFQQYGQRLAGQGARTPLDFLMLRSVLGSRSGTPSELANAYEEMETGAAFANGEVLSRVFTQIKGQVSDRGLQKMLMNRVLRQGLPQVALSETNKFARAIVSGTPIDQVAKDIKRVSGASIVDVAGGITPEAMKELAKVQDKITALGIKMVPTLEQFEKAAAKMADKMSDLAPMIAELANRIAHNY